MDTLRQPVPAGDPASSGAPLAGHGLPLSIAVPLPALLESARDSRALVSRTLAAWGVMSEDATLVVSELIANAVHATAGTRIPLVLLRMAYAAGELLVEAGDACPAGPPSPDSLTPGPEDTSGRGLQIVVSLSSSWGWYRDGAWKFVWASLPASRPAPAPGPASGVRAGDVRRAA